MRKTIPALASAILLLGSIASFGQEQIVPYSALERLQSITEKIRACKEVDITPVDPTSKEQVPFRIFDGPPLNVTWDIKKSDSLIKPYYGVIEFVTYGRMWAPDDLMEKSKRLAEMVTQYNLEPPALKHRYIFEPVHGELQLSAMTETGSDSSEIAEPKTFRCWQVAAGVQ